MRAAPVYCWPQGIVAVVTRRVSSAHAAAASWAAIRSRSGASVSSTCGDASPDGGAFPWPRAASSVPGFDDVVNQPRYVVSAARCGVAQLVRAYA